jgi:hypothetical protein
MLQLQAASYLNATLDQEGPAQALLVLVRIGVGCPLAGGSTTVAQFAPRAAGRGACLHFFFGDATSCKHTICFVRSTRLQQWPVKCLNVTQGWTHMLCWLHITATVVSVLDLGVP